MRMARGLALPLALACAILALCVLQGCSDKHEGTSQTGDTSTASAETSSDTSVVGADPSNTGMPDAGADPLASAAAPTATSATPGADLAPTDPFGKGISDPAEGKDGLTGNYDPVSQDHTMTPQSNPLLGGRQVKNWYWMRGTIFGGRINITINHISIGSYTARIDMEITDRLREGINDVQFEQIPSTPHTPVRAHLDVVYSQQASGALPVLTYDTQQMAKLMQSATTQSDADTLPDPNAWKHPVNSYDKTYTRQTDILTFDAF